MSNIAPLIHRKIVVLHENDSCEAAARAMESHGIGCVVVDDSYGHMTGILTDRDLACRILAQSRDSATPLIEAMTPDPAHVRESDDLEKVSGLMERYGIRRIPVIQMVSGGREKCIGLISLDDLIANRKLDPAALGRIVRSQILRRIRGSGHFRSHQRAESRSIRRLQEVMSLATELPEEKSSKLLLLVLSTLVRRLHHSAALRIIGRVPDELQTELLELPVGPDRSFNADHLVVQAKQELGLDTQEARIVIHRVCRAFEEWLGPEQFEHVKHQLPADLHDSFLPMEPEELPGLRVPRREVTRAVRTGTGYPRGIRPDDPSPRER